MSTLVAVGADKSIRFAEQVVSSRQSAGFPEGQISAIVQDPWDGNLVGLTVGEIHRGSGIDAAIASRLGSRAIVRLKGWVLFWPSGRGRGR
ncbi:MAG: hypothetical protein ABSF61_08260 [Anaerolineales bacterium]|jgi:hypothetical protein